MTREKNFKIKESTKFIVFSKPLKRNKKNCLSLKTLWHTSKNAFGVVILPCKYNEIEKAKDQADFDQI